MLKTIKNKKTYKKLKINKKYKNLKRWSRQPPRPQFMILSLAESVITFKT